MWLLGIVTGGEVLEFLMGGKILKFITRGKTQSQSLIQGRGSQVVTVEPRNIGCIGTFSAVLCRKVVLFLEVNLFIAFTVLLTNTNL